LGSGPRIGVVGATGAVGTITLELLRERGYHDVRLFASARSAGMQLSGTTVEEATPEVLAAGDLDLCLFSVGTSASRELVPHAVRGGAVCVDKSAAYRLEPGIPLGDHPDRPEAIGIACSLLRRLWRPVPEDHPFSLVRDLASRLADELPGRFVRQDRPFDEQLLRRAVDLCRDLGGSSEEAVLANRDFHLWNVLAAEREPWLVIDPKPLVGERAFDTGHFVRTLLPERLELSSVDTIVGRLATELVLEPARIHYWAFVRSVDDALWGLSAGGTDVEWDVRCAHLLAERL